MCKKHNVINMGTLRDSCFRVVHLGTNVLLVALHSQTHGLGNVVCLRKITHNFVCGGILVFGLPIPLRLYFDDGACDVCELLLRSAGLTNNDLSCVC